ncbi:MAG: ABC transporter ATP-binding protein [Deltaproteobacteria bacterium]
MASVQMDQVKKQFGEVEVLKEVSLTIQSGEFVVLVGPSGCGKSTLLRMVAGLELPTSGNILIDSKVVTTVAPKSRGVAMVFQNYALYPHMTVRDNLKFGLKLAKVEKAEIERRITEAADVLGLAAHLDKKPGQLSGGQKQRVAMGRAMVRQPKVFLFDEPLSNLDAQLRVKMRTEISHLHRKLKATSIYVTHDQVEAMTLADRIAVMYQGKLEQVGTPLELYQNPKTKFVASFIGTPSMNFLEKSLLAKVQAPSLALSAGIRPEFTYLGKKSEKEPSRLGEGKVVLVEPLGSLAYVHVAIEGQYLVSEVKSDTFPLVGDSVSVGVETSKLFFFNEQGLRI